MSLTTQIDALAIRVAQEINAVRSEIGSSGGPNYIGHIDGGGPTTTNWFGSALDGGTP